MDRFERIPLRGYETQQIMLIYATLSECHFAIGQKGIENRLRRVGRYSQMKGIVTHLDHILTDVLDTVPVEKLLTIRKNIQHQAIKVVTKNDPASNETDWSYVSDKALRDITRAACSNECLICDGTGGEMATCALRKALKQVVISEDERLANGDMMCIGKGLLATTDDGAI